MFPQVGDLVVDLATDGAHRQTFVKFGVGCHSAIGAVAPTAGPADEPGATVWNQQRCSTQSGLFILLFILLLYYSIAFHTGFIFVYGMAPFAPLEATGTYCAGAHSTPG